MERRHGFSVLSQVYKDTQDYKETTRGDTSVFYAKPIAYIISVSVFTWIHKDRRGFKRPVGSHMHGSS